MQKLDKKQLPQLIALIGLTCLVFGWFAYRMIMPSQAAAGSAVPAAPPSAAPVAVSTATAPGGASPAASASVATAVTGPPVPGMRDPFVQTISASPASASPASAPPASAPPASTPPASTPDTTRPAGQSRLTSLHDGLISVPAAPPLPPVGFASLPSGARSGLAPMPVALPAPLWTVTGILQSGSEQVAILRNGAARLFVRQGDTVDGQFQVARVTRSAVLLRRGSVNFTLMLGDAKPALQAVPMRAAPVQAAPHHAAPVPVMPAVFAPDISVPSAHPAVSSSRAPLAAPQLALTTFADARPVPAAQLRRVRSHAPALMLADLKPSAVAILSQTALPRTAFSGAALSGKAVIKVAGLRQSVGGSHRVGVSLPDYNLPSALLPAGTLAPDFSLPTAIGQTLSVSDFRGRVVLLCFWASWVPACQTALPELEQLQNALGGQGLTVLGVNSWDNRPAMSAFVRAQGLSQVTLCDTRVPNQSAAVALYHAPDLPAFYLLDANGRVAASFTGYGPHTLSHLRAALNKMGVSDH